MSLLFSTCHETDDSLPTKSNADLTGEELKRLVLLDTSYLYPLEQAKATVLTLAQQLLDKDGINRTISEVLPLPSLYSLTGKTAIKTDYSVSKPKTPSLYVANFNNKNGFVILSADKRATEILATVATGSMDSLSNSGLRVFLSKAITHIDEKVAEMESLRGDSIFWNMVNKLNEPFPKVSEKSGSNGRVPCKILKVYVPGVSAAGCGRDCYLTSSVVPILTVNTVNTVAQPILGTMLWHQKPPYNNWQTNAGCYTTSSCGTNRNYPAGCVAIAESQVVAYFKSKNDYMWKSIAAKSCSGYTSTESDAAARLAMDIFEDYGIYIDRSCDEVGAGISIGSFYHSSPKGISPKYGLVKGEWRDYNYTDLRNSLVSGSPVVTSGFDGLTCVWLIGWPCWGSGNGHEWVIDGMRDLGVRTTYQVTSYYTGADCTAAERGNRYTYTYDVNSTTSTQVHQNWGWGVGTGSGANDWYAEGVFKSTAASNNFNHQVQIVAYIGQP